MESFEIIKTRKGFVLKSKYNAFCYFIPKHLYVNGIKVNVHIPDEYLHLF